MSESERAIIRNFFSIEKTFEGAKQDAFEFFGSKTGTSAAVVKEVVGILLNEGYLTIQTQTSYDPKQKASTDIVILKPQIIKQTENASKKHVKREKRNPVQNVKGIYSLQNSRSFVQNSKHGQSGMEPFRELFGLPRNTKDRCNDPLKGIQELLCDYFDKKADALELLKQVRRGID
jgi:hypothetical protein